MRTRLLSHIQLSSDLFLTTELHNEVLITRLALPNRCAEAKLAFMSQYNRQPESNVLLLTMNSTCWSSLGSRNSREMLAYMIL